MTARTPSPGLGTGAADLTLLGEQMRREGITPGLGMPGPRSPPWALAGGRELSADSLCSF